jgi:hypothetical protein
MRFPYGVMVTIVRAVPGGTDPYGDPIPGTTERIDIPRCGLAPRMSMESSARGRQGVIVGQTVYLPEGSPAVLYIDQLEVAGVLYDIEGDPGLWVSPFTGWAPGIEVAVKRAVG